MYYDTNDHNIDIISSWYPAHPIGQHGANDIKAVHFQKHGAQTPVIHRDY